MSFTPKIWNDNDILSILDLNRLEEAVAEMGNYTPTVWAVGDKITAEKMNKLEQGVAGEFWNTVFEGNVTTTVQLETGPSAGANLVLSSSLTADSVKVTFNGTEYTLPKNEYGYGYVGQEGPDFSEYPLFILTTTTPYTLYTETAGTYSLKIEELQSGESSDFSTVQVTIINNSSGNITWAEPRIRHWTNPDMDILSIGNNLSLAPNNSMTIEKFPVAFDGTNVEIQANDAFNAEGSGDVNITSGGNFADAFITGDCTITISAIK